MNWSSIVPLSQLSAQWRDVQLGTCSGATIGNGGCLIADFAMLGRTTPDYINRVMLAGGHFYKGCLAATFDIRDRIGIVAAPALAGVTASYQSVPFPQSQITRVWSHVAAGRPAIVCVDADPKTAKFEQHWVLLVGAFGWPDSRRDFVINDPNGGVQLSFRERYGELPRALVRAVLYDDAPFARDLVAADARQEARAWLPGRAS